ncbi:hypothetical protein EYD45_04945 [Hyunsoonleella flava]|uniref:Sulfatase N-terminal domain-containing protein n=1 Tax=Hyunsoonleella flava TaxID=2527939 RepID=A0A4V2JAD1_9FLAO|nr:sulfatase-like hydrolase/transferase [Hyunsoonleella flava]TBN05624.1 hypothetical protein EYD45_04945 [Hyunsoonleella flava]
MKDFLNVYKRFIYIAIPVFFVECYLNGFSLATILNLIENLIFATLIIIPFGFISNRRVSIIYFIISIILFACTLFFEVTYKYLFKTFFSASAIFVMLDSNLEESKEFLAFYVDKPVIIFLFVILVLIVIALYNFRVLNFERLWNKNFSKIKLVGLFVLILVFLKFTKLIDTNTPYLITRAISGYITETNRLGNYKDNKKGSFQNVRRVSKKDEEEVYVVLIGESTNRDHLQIYGYHRETTPNLKKREAELLIYDNVISPHAYSVGALAKILTLGNYENPENISKGSIIQLFNRIGFKTYWLSNQRPIGPFESMITKISLSANKYKFLTTSIAGNNQVLDGDLINEFNDALKEPVPKKAIFLHLMGTHHHYENRYPEAFNEFKNNPKTKFLSDESKTKINHYDNAILYNDFVISQVINKLDSLDVKSFALYFSDHGEEMYRDLDMAGHNEDVYSKQMFEVPFFLWKSEKFNKLKTISYFKNRSYMIDDFFHSIADMLDVSADEVDSSRSIFSQYFKERKRIIKDTINYDTFFD